jgi:predicted transposase/invertase (TIGR01784 family)
MYDNTCKFIAENFPDAIATWLLGKSVKLTQLSPKELSLEPIRADSLILQQSEDLVLHVEFQTKPSEEIPFRMADYRLRVYRRFPQKRMVQVVVYLKPSKSPLVSQDYFRIKELQARFRVIRLWEQPKEIFFQLPGLLPFAVLSKTDNRYEVLKQVAIELDKIESRRDRSNLSAASNILAGLALDEYTISQIIRRDIMRESVIYQAILREGELIGEQRGRLEGEQRGRLEGEQQGILEGKQQIARNLLKSGMTLEQVVQLTDLPLEVVQSLREEDSL